MAAEISSSGSGAQSELVPEKRPPMPDHLFSALMSKGKENDIIKYLGMSEEQQEVKVQVDASCPTLQQKETQNQTINIQSATQSGDTVLHLLVHNGQDDHALKVFLQEKSLLEAQNNNLETPLHIAARTGNKNIVCKLIQLKPEIVKDALAKTNYIGNTALHIAARHNNIEIGCELLKLDPQVAKKENDQGLSPLYVAIYNRCNNLVQTMLQNDPNLVCTPNSDGIFPIHVAASKGDKNLVKHIMEKYPNHANLLDPHGSNLFHVAAKENQSEIFGLSQHWKDENAVKKMNKETDYEGNTPLHIVAIMGHRLTMSVIYKNSLNLVAETIRNREGFTPLQLSARQLEDSSKSEINDIKVRIDRYISNNGYKFSLRWFEDIMAPSDESKWERTQVIGLGAVLITTVTFAAAFTIPGGYNQDDGTPILGRRIAYKAFTVANTLSFALTFTSLYTLVSSALVDPDYAHLKDATDTFTASAGFMVLAFALGSYVTLVPVSFPIAIIVLILTVPLGSPFMSHAVRFYRSIYKYIYRIINWMLEHKYIFMLGIGSSLAILVGLLCLLLAFAIFVGILKLSYR